MCDESRLRNALAGFSHFFLWNSFDVTFVRRLHSKDIEETGRPYRSGVSGPPQERPDMLLSGEVKVVLFFLFL